MNDQELHPVVAHHINVKSKSLGRTYALGLAAVIALWALGSTLDKVSSRIVEQQKVVYNVAR